MNHKKLNVTRNGTPKLSCSYICTWLTDPTERMIDVVTVGWGNGQGSFDYTESYSATYSYIGDAVWYTDNGDNTYTKHESSQGYTHNLSYTMRNTAQETGLSCKTTLRDYYEEVVGITTYEYTYRNHVFSMNFYLTNIGDTSYTYLHGQYFHQKKAGAFTINGVTASFNILSGVASLTLSGNYSTSTYYSQIGDTALLNHTY